MGNPKSDPSSKCLEAEAGHLVKMMSIDPTVSEQWTEEDLSAILRHQLSASIGLELGPVYGQRLRTQRRAPDEMKNFQQLFEHPNPPVWLLKLAKEYFKAQAGDSPNRQPEQKVAYLLYLVVLLVARVRSSTSITRLSDRELFKGVEWAAAQPWVDDHTRSIIFQSRNSFNLPG